MHEIGYIYRKRGSTVAVVWHRSRAYKPLRLSASGTDADAVKGRGRLWGERCGGHSVYVYKHICARVCVYKIRFSARAFFRQLPPALSSSHPTSLHPPLPSGTRGVARANIENHRAAGGGGIGRWRVGAEVIHCQRNNCPGPKRNYRRPSCTSDRWFIAGTRATEINRRRRRHQVRFGPLNQMQQCYFAFGFFFFYLFVFFFAKKFVRIIYCVRM